MERLVYYMSIVFLLTLLSDQTLSQNKSSNDTLEDVPMNVKLGQPIVGRKNESVIPINTTSSLFMEGGSLNKTLTETSIPEKKVKKPTTLLSTDRALPEEMVVSWPESHDKNSSSKPRKGAPTCSCCVNITTEEQLKSCSCCPGDFSITPTLPPVISSTFNQSTTLPTTTSKIEITTLNSNMSISTSNVTVVQPMLVTHHKKPNVTADAPDPQVPAQQEDYVIPVVGIIFAIPLIIILGALVYKKGADLWERRHYRRMDFLIDGIYNQ